MSEIKNIFVGNSYDCMVEKIKDLESKLDSYMKMRDELIEMNADKDKKLAEANNMLKTNLMHVRISALEDTLKQRQEMCTLYIKKLALAKEALDIAFDELQDISTGGRHGKERESASEAMRKIVEIKAFKQLST